MGSISNARANVGLSATGSPTGVQVSGSSTIGTPQQTFPFTSSDVCYSLTITATGSGDVATLDMETGAVTQTTGTPSVTRRAGSISDLAGLDFEGAPLPQALNLYGLLVSSIGANNADGVTVASAEGSYPTITLGITEGSACLLAIGGPHVATTEPITFTFVTIGDSVTITVVAQS